jgi:putative ATP-dependent endonuclease of the OLD family
MRVVTFSVENFRSIKKAEKLPIAQKTVLIGPNNEGKSNILRALVVSLQVLRALAFDAGVRPLGSALARFVNWETDYPRSLQEAATKPAMKFTVEFELDTDELAQFKATIKSSLNGSLPIQISIRQDKVEFRVKKPGRGAEALTKKSKEIARFVGSQLEIRHIPAVRTVEQAERVVFDLADLALKSLEKDDAYQSALAVVTRLQDNVLQDLGTQLNTVLTPFLPGIKEVRVGALASGNLSRSRRGASIVVDDGSATPLEQKGDGVISLATLGLLKQYSNPADLGRDQVLAIEEPESHLHPDAIHRVVSTLDELALHQQVIISTHCPILVNRSSVQSNILVRGGQAKVAKAIEEIREILGVRVSDNLMHAKFALVVEGDEDFIAMNSILRAASPKISAQLDSGAFAVETMTGGANLGYRLERLRSAMCSYHVLLDDDSAGRLSFERANAAGLVSIAEVTFTTAPGLEESKFEDLLEPALTNDILTQYGVAIVAPKRDKKSKWSLRTKEIFRLSGKPWNEKIKSTLKHQLAEKVSAAPLTSLSPSRRSVVDSMIASIESRIEAC